MDIDSPTGNRKNIASKIRKQREAPWGFTHRRVLNIYLHKVPFTSILNFTDDKTP